MRFRTRIRMPRGRRMTSTDHWLQLLVLAGTSSMKTSPGFPPNEPLPALTSSPVFSPPRAVGMQQSVSLPVYMAPSSDGVEATAWNKAEFSDSACSSPDPEHDTKQSLDFTGEHKSLREAGAGDRMNFVEQLETAFTSSPAFDASVGLGSLELNHKLGISPTASMNL